MSQYVFDRLDDRFIFADGYRPRAVAATGRDRLNGRIRDGVAALHRLHALTWTIWTVTGEEWHEVTSRR